MNSRSPDLLSDARWQTALRFAAGESVHPNSRESLAARRRAENAVRSLEAETHGEGEAPRLRSYAASGRQFLNGLYAFENNMEYIYSATQVENFGPRRKEYFSPEFKEQLLKACELIENTCNAMDNIALQEAGNEPKLGPNAKPALHSAVGMLWIVWKDLVGERRRKKVDFLLFARFCLEPAKATVTDNSVLESFDRHVRPKLKPPPKF